MRLTCHGSPARAASAAPLIDTAVTLAQHSSTPATPASLTKIAAVRGEKNSAKAIAPARRLWTAARLSAAAARLRKVKSFSYLILGIGVLGFALVSRLRSVPSQPGADDASPLLPRASWRRDRAFAGMPGLVAGVVFWLGSGVVFAIAVGIEWNALSDLSNEFAGHL